MSCKIIPNKKVYRCDGISSVDGFLSMRNVLKYEMFGDESDTEFRNFDGMVIELKEIFPELNMESILEKFDVHQLKTDEAYKFKFIDCLIESLQKDCGVPEGNFKYGIWACDTPEMVTHNYDTYGMDISTYILKDAVMFSDLMDEGQLYGVSEYPEPEENINMDESLNKTFQEVYDESVCAAGASGISNMAPQHMTACVDQKVGNISRFTGGNGGKIVKSTNDIIFDNDSMKAHKKSSKKGDAITGTGIVYANGKFMEAFNKFLESYDWDEEIHERIESGDYETPTECCNCGADCSDNGEIIYGDLYCPSCARNERLGESGGYKVSTDKLNETESNSSMLKEHASNGWSDNDSLFTAYEMINSGNFDYTKKQVMKELLKTPYFTKKFDEMEKESKESEHMDESITNWDNATSNELEKVSNDVYNYIQSFKKE